MSNKHIMRVNSCTWAARKLSTAHGLKVVKSSKSMSICQTNLTKMHTLVNIELSSCLNWILGLVVNHDVRMMERAIPIACRHKAVSTRSILCTWYRYADQRKPKLKTRMLEKRGYENVLCQIQDSSILIDNVCLCCWLSHSQEAFCRRRVSRVPSRIFVQQSFAFSVEWTETSCRRWTLERLRQS